MTAKRKATRMEALAVLRGEMDREISDGAECCARALQRAIDVLEGAASPSEPAPSADPGIGRRGVAETFMEGMLGE